MSVALGIDTLGIDPLGVSLPPEAVAIDAAVTPGTTLAAIREALVSVIDTLSPRTLADYPFRYSDAQTAEWREYAAEHEASTFRRYVIELEGWEPVSVYDLAYQRRSASFAVVMAYPHAWGTYAAQDTGRLLNFASLEDTAEDDLSLILKKIGVAGSSNYPSAAAPVSETAPELETLDGITFGIARVTVEFFYKTVG